MRRQVIPGVTCRLLRVEGAEQTIRAKDRLQALDNGSNGEWSSWRNLRRRSELG